MIGQHVDALDVAQGLQEVAQPEEVFVPVGDLGHEHVANPYGLVNLREVAGTVENVPVGMAGELPVLLVVDVLDVQEQEVCDHHEPLEFREIGFTPGERLCRGVEAGVDAAFLRLGEQLCQEVDLQEGLSTAHGDATALSPVATEALGLVKEFIGRHLDGGMVAVGHFPGVGIVTIPATHGTALQEDKKPNPRAVNGAKGFG